MVPSQNLWVDQESEHQITVRGQSVTLSTTSAKLALVRTRCLPNPTATSGRATNVVHSQRAEVSEEIFKAYHKGSLPALTLQNSRAAISLNLPDGHNHSGCLLQKADLHRRAQAQWAPHLDEKAFHRTLTTV